MGNGCVIGRVCQEAERVAAEAPEAAERPEQERLPRRRMNRNIGIIVVVAVAVVIIIIGIIILVSLTGCEK